MNQSKKLMAVWWTRHEWMWFSGWFAYFQSRHGVHRIRNPRWTRRALKCATPWRPCDGWDCTRRPIIGRSGSNCRRNCCSGTAPCTPPTRRLCCAPSRRLSRRDPGSGCTRSTCEDLKSTKPLSIYLCTIVCRSASFSDDMSCLHYLSFLNVCSYCCIMSTEPFNKFS